MKVNGLTKPENDKPELCDRVTKPADVEPCQVPCPMDCVVSDWSEWSGCPQVGKV